MTFVVTMSAQEGFKVDVQTVRTMHYMLLNHDMTKRPVQFRVLGERPA